MDRSLAKTLVPGELVARLEVAEYRPYSASSRRDVTDLAWAVECVKVEDEERIAASIIYHDLMRGPWWFGAILWFIRKRSNPIGRLMFFYRRTAGEARHLITETARHIRHGIDREEASSVGGFSQREVNIMFAILKARTAAEADAVGMSRQANGQKPPDALTQTNHAGGGET